MPKIKVPLRYSEFNKKYPGARFRYSYSIQPDEEGNTQYEIINHGFQHLLSDVFLYQLENPGKILGTLQSIKLTCGKGVVQLKQINDLAFEALESALRVFEKNNVFKCSYDRHRIYEITSLKNAERSYAPYLTAYACLIYLLGYMHLKYGIQFQIKQSMPYYTSEISYVDVWSKNTENIIKSYNVEILEQPRNNLQNLSNKTHFFEKLLFLLRFKYNIVCSVPLFLKSACCCKNAIKTVNTADYYCTRFECFQHACMLDIESFNNRLYISKRVSYSNLVDLLHYCGVYISGDQLLTLKSSAMCGKYLSTDKHYILEEIV